MMILFGGLGQRERERPSLVPGDRHGRKSIDRVPHSQVQATARHRRTSSDIPHTRATRGTDT